MNDEHDHDTEHIEKKFGLGNRKKEDNDNVEDSSATHNSTDGVANKKSGGWGVLSGWKKQADGKVDEPTYEGNDGGNGTDSNNPRKQRYSDNEWASKKDQYDDYVNMSRSGMYSYSNTPNYEPDDVDENGEHEWEWEYGDMVGRRRKRDRFAEEYRQRTGRDFNRKGVYSENPLSWEDWENAYSEFGYARDKDGNIDWDRINRDIARGYVHNYVNKQNEGDEYWTSPDDYADTARHHNAYYDTDEEFAERYGITDDQLQEAYRQFNETGQIDPAIFADKDTSSDEAEQAAEALTEELQDQQEGEQDRNNARQDSSEPGAVVPQGTDSDMPRKDTYDGPPLAGPNGETLNDNFASKQQEWKPSVTSQRMMDAGLAGLNMFGGIVGGANKAFSMLRGLASALTSRQLMSDPTLPARGFLNAMEQSGQIVEDHIRQVGETYGIKDGVKRDDLVGTYKGAQYYREKQQIENAEKQYYAGVGNALSAVLGGNVDVNDTVGIQNALAQMSPQQLSQLDDALFGRNGSLKDMYEATVVNPMGSTREQKARAQLLTTLNQSLKGQAQANAREAGRQRTQANQQIQQYRQQSRQLKETDMANYRQAQQQVADPASMAGMSGREQMRAIIHSAIGRRIISGDIPMQRSANGQWGMLNTDQLDINALNAIRRTLEGGQIMNHPATQQAAQQLYNEVQSKLNEARQRGVQFRQQQRQNRLAPFMDSPLEYDIEDRGGRRDRYGIPESAASRRTLYNNAWYTMQDLIAKGGDKNDIALCENVMQMCDMADFRENLMNDVRKMELNGVITPMEADLVRQNADRAYEEMASALPMTRAKRDEYINKGQDWTPNQRTEAMYNNMQALGDNLDNITRYHAQAERERRAEMAQAERDERMKPYQNSPVDLDINSGSKADRDAMGIPTDKGKRNKLYVKAQNMLRDLRQNGGKQEDIDLCRNVMALCGLADRRDELTNTVRDLRKSGAISALEEEMYLDEANRYYDLASAELATTVDDRNARMEAKEDWTENLVTENMSTQMDNLRDIIEETRTGFTAQERDRRRAQEQARRDAQRSAEMEPYQNSPVDLDLMNGKGKGNRDRYHIPRTYSGQRNLRDNADDMIRTLIDEGGSPQDISLCENVRTLANAAMHRSEIESYLSKLEAKGKISKEEAELARQNAFRAYTDLANRLPVTVKDRDARIQAKQAWEQDDSTDNLSIDLESTMNHLKYLEGEHDTRVREDREAMREQRRRERAENRARAAENARQERADEWEAQANRDDRGISLASDPKYRKKDVQKWGDQLKRIEADMMNATSPEAMLRLTKEKMDVETKIRQTLQEDHIQKLIAKAGALDPFARAEVQKRAEALRDTTSDWNEFGKALNDIYKDYQGLGSDRTWASSRKAEEAQRKQARLDSIGGKLDQMIGLMKNLVTGQGTINNSIWTSSHQMFSEFEDYLDRKFRGQVQAMGRNRTQLIKAFTDFYKDTVKKDVEGMVSGAVSTLTDSMKGSCDRMEGAIKGLGQEAQDRFMPLLQDISGNTAYLTRQLKGFYTKSDGDVSKILDAAKKQVQAINNMGKAINGFSSLGGKYIDGPLKIDEAQWNELKSQFSDLEEYKKSVNNLVNMYRNGAYPSAEEISKTFLELMSGYDRHNPDLEGEGPERWKKISEMFQRFDETRGKADAVLTNIQLFNEDRENFAIPATLVDDFNEFLRQKYGGKGQNETPSGAAYDDARNEASETGQETVPGATGPEVEEQVDQSVEEAQTATEEGGTGEIYGEGKYGEAILTPEEKEELGGTEQPVEKPISEMSPEEFDRYMEDNYSDLFSQNEDLSKGMRQLRSEHPLLFNYVINNPDSLLDMYVAEASMNGKGGQTLHQSYKNLLQNAQVYRAFGDDDETNEKVVEQMVDDMLGASTIPEAKQIENRWLGDNPSEARAAIVNNASSMINRYLSDLFTVNAKRKYDAELAGATQEGLNAEAVRDYFRYLHKEAKPTQAELKAAKRAATNELKRQKEEEEARKVRESHVEPTAQKLGMDLTTENGKAAFDIIYDNLISKGRDALYDISNRPNVKQDYRNTLQALRDLKTAEGDEAFNKIMGSIIPSMFREAGVVQGNNITDASAGFDSRAAQIGLELGRAGKVPKGKRGAANNEMRDPKEFSMDSLYDAWLKGDHNASTNGHLTKNALIDAYALGKQVVAREKKVASYYDPVMSGTLFKDQIAKLNGALDEMDKVDSWDDLNARFKNNKTGNERYNAYKNARDTLDKHISVAKENLDYLKGLRARVTNGFYEEADKLGVTIPPEKIKEMTDTLSKELAVIDKMSERYSAKLQDFNHLKNSLSHITEKTAQELAEEERVNAQNNADGASGQPKSGANSQEAYDKRSNKAASALSGLRDELVGSKNVQSAMNSVQRRSKETDEQFQLRQMFVGLNALFKEKGDDAGEFLNKLAVDLGLRKNTKKDRWSTMNEPQVKRIASAILYGSGKLTDRKYDGVWPPKEESKQETVKEETPVGQPTQTESGELDLLDLTGAGDSAIIPEEKEEAKKSVIGNNLLDEDMF